MNTPLGSREPKTTKTKEVIGEGFSEIREGKGSQSLVLKLLSPVSPQGGQVGNGYRSHSS